MFKNALIFGLLGFIIPLGTIYVTIPEEELTSQESSSLSYTDGINGWISFGNILAQNINEAFAMEDDFFISMFFRKTMEDINLSNKPEIIITEKNGTIFWTNGTKRAGTEYAGWNEQKDNKNFFIKDFQSTVKIDITSSNKEINGYLYLIIQNEPNPKEFSNTGWQYYGHVLASSNDIRSFVDERSSSGIKDYFNKVTKKESIFNLTILSEDKTVIWDINNSNIGKKMEGGWIEEEKGKNKSDRFYFSLPVKYQERDIADIYFLAKVPVAKGASSIGNLTMKIKEILKIKHLMVPAVSFVIFAFLGSILSKPARGSRVKAESLEGGSPEFQNKIQLLKEEIKQLETTKENVMEEVAKKQKEQKDLEKEIELLKTKKITMPSKAELEIAEAVTTVETKEEEERSEEDLLFDKLLGESSKKGAKKKEELELTQRIVAKRREEITLSGKVETRRKELMKLEQQIEKLKDKK